MELDVIYNRDYLVGMKKLPDESIDLVATDPPYESLNRWKGVGTTARMGLGRKTSKSYDPSKFFETIPNEQLPEMMEELYRVLKPNTHCYVMCDNITLPCFYSMMNGTSFNNLKPLIWDKVNMGMGYHYRCRYEFVLMFDKGRRKLEDLSIPDVLRFKKYAGEVPTEKPVRLFELLIEQSSNKGEIVLDPFMGSGTTAVAAKRLGRHFIGFETNPRYCEMARKRSSQVQLELI